jgi:hypothetical protein
VSECANQAQEAIALVFSAQIMRTRLDRPVDLEEHHRTAILATLGVDVEAAGYSPIYNEELISDRLSRLRDTNRNLCIRMNSVLTDANLTPQTTEQAA